MSDKYTIKTNKGELVRRLIEESKGKLFTVVFVKSDDKVRVMNCRTGVSKFIKGGKSTIAGKENLINVWDVKSEGYRCFNVDSVLMIKISGQEYDFTELNKGDNNE